MPTADVDFQSPMPNLDHLDSRNGNGSSAAIKLPEIDTRGIYEGKFTDRNPYIRAAGKFTTTCDSAQECMKAITRPESPDVIKRFRATIRPDAGKMRVFYGKANDPHLKWAAAMTHGQSTQPSLMAGDLANPQPNSLFRQRLMDKKQSIYASHLRGPLGKSHDQSPGLPAQLNPDEFTFGIQTFKDGSACELVSPNKSRQQVNSEYEQGRELYRCTHFDYKVGEQCDRNYVSPSFTKSANFGVPTPHFNDGRHVRKTLKWQHDTQSENAAPIVSRRVDDFRERTQPQLGKVHDPIKDTLNVSPEHTFGILVKPDEYGVGDLLHGRAPGEYLRGKDRLRGLIASMRQLLKKSNFHNFPDLLAAFQHYDKSGSGKINIHDLREVCLQLHLPSEPELLEQLMDYCDADKDGLINYTEFANFLNWKDKLPNCDNERLVQSAPAAALDGNSSQRMLTPGRLQKQIDRSIGDHRTSNSMINAVVGGFSTKGYRTYGVPTIRTDLPAPRIRRVSDRMNYGDESDAYGLVNPSIYSTSGVHEKDFLLPRSKEEIRKIFTNIGVVMDHDTFDKVYTMAESQHPMQQVSVESMRNMLDQCQAKIIRDSNGIMY